MLTAVPVPGDDGRIRIEEPGVYDIPAAQYHRDPVVGGSLTSSGAKQLMPPNCPAIYKHWRENGQDPKPAFDLGRVTHSLTLGVGEPVVVIKAKTYKSKAAQDERDAAYADGATPILEHEFETAQAMAEAVRAHPRAAEMLDPAIGAPERTLVWRDPFTGVMCRGLVDYLHDPIPGEPLIIPDVKTAEKVDPESISRAIASYVYHGQGAWYSDGVEALGLSVPNRTAVVLIFVRKAAPHLVVCAQISPDDLARGRERNEKARDLYRWCTAQNHWPAYLGNTGRGPGYTDDHVISVPIPTWSAYAHDGASERGEFLPEGMKL